MRPLFFDFAHDPTAADVEDEFLFGPDLLVAPILKYQVRHRNVYLPAGVEWTDAWTGERLAGGQTIGADAPIERIPVYVRGNDHVLLDLFRDIHPVEEKH
jgi:alpha-D-xyloside xylohydrolase